MAAFKDIIGQDMIVRHFQRAIQEGKVSHSYIINGEEHSGKRMLAEAFAKALQCREGGTEGCGTCRSCLQAESHNHPDIIYVTHEKTVIAVDDIREQIVNTMDIKPYSSPYKIYIVDEADKMNEQAQNALLKTIEEPPAYGIIILLANNANRLLPTILSRCVLLKIRPADDRQLKQFLMSSLQIPDYSAQIAVSFAQGNVGKAVGYATSETFGERKDQILELVKRLPGISLTDLIARVKSLAEMKKEISVLLDFMLLWYRDVLLYKASGKEELLLYREESRAVREQAEAVSYEGLDRCLKAMEEARARFRANVNFEVNLEMMLVCIKDQFEQ